MIMSVSTMIMSLRVFERPTAPARIRMPYATAPQAVVYVYVRRLHGVGSCVVVCVLVGTVSPFGGSTTTSAGLAEI
jgi:hypothetical protein